jgi:hypothetical protein
VSISRWAETHGLAWKFPLREEEKTWRIVKRRALASMQRTHGAQRATKSNQDTRNPIRYRDELHRNLATVILRKSFILLSLYLVCRILMETKRNCSITPELTLWSITSAATRKVQLGKT